MSVSLHIQQSRGGPEPLVFSQFWTFDKTTNRPLTLEQLVPDIAARQQLQQLATDAPYTPVNPQLASPQRPAQLAPGFIAIGEDMLGLLFSTGPIDWPLAKQAVVTLPISQLTKQLKSPTAKALFAIPEPFLGNCQQAKCLALTFDDGPGPHTARLLEILERYQARSTFFVLGSKVPGGAALLQQMHQAGHQIGNHTWNHPVLPNLSPEAVQAEIVSTTQAIQSATGLTNRVMRPPYGAIDSAVRDQLKALGLPVILWSVDTRDWADRNSQLVCQRAVHGAHRGGIILLHDIHPTSVDAVPCIVSQLQKQGYRLVTVDRLLGAMEPGRSYSAAD